MDIVFSLGVETLTTAYQETHTRVRDIAVLIHKHRSDLNPCQVCALRVLTVKFQLNAKIFKGATCIFQLSLHHRHWH